MITKQLTESALLKQYDNDEKAVALALFLDLTKDDKLEQSSYTDNEYTVNERKVKRGYSPKEYMQIIADLKLLLTKSEKSAISRKVKSLTTGKAVNKKHSNDLYHKISSALSERKASQTPEQQAADDRLVKNHLYVVNTLYSLFDRQADYDRESEYINSLRQAWQGITPKNTRENAIENDGEYLVLTDDEADTTYDEALDNYIDECILPEMPEMAQNYFDYDACKRDLQINSSRGDTLNRYDGTEEYITVNGTDYFIYRTN